MQMVLNSFIPSGKYYINHTFRLVLYNTVQIKNLNRLKANKSFKDETVSVIANILKYV